MKRLLILTAIIMIMVAASTSGGDYPGRFGLGLSATESSPTFALQLLAGPYYRLEGTMAVSHARPDDDDSSTRWRLGFGIFYNFRQGTDFRPFVGGRFIYDFISGYDEKYVDIIGGPSFGAEYYFSKHFSVRGEYMVRIIKTDDVISPSLLPANTTYIETTQFLSVNFYL